jgi:hypothetical protein
MVMEHVAEDSSLIDSLTLGAVEKYLMLKGWKLVDITNKKMKIYAGPLADDGYPIEIVLPTYGTIEDNRERIAGSLRTLAVIEKCSASILVQNIQQTGNDIWRVALGDQIVRQASVSLNIASKFIHRMKKFLYSAGAAEDTSLLVIRKSIKAGAEFMEDCRFGHTFQSSFGFTISRPLDAFQEALPYFSEAAPFERRVMERIARGIHLTSMAINEQNVEFACESYEIGFNANMIDDFNHLVKIVGGGDLKFGFVWSKIVDVPSDIISSSIIKTGPATIEFLTEVSKKMHNIKSQEPVQIRGLVTQLKSKEIPTLENFRPGSREIHIANINSDIPLGEYRLTLGIEDYQKALEAHSLGKIVSVSGTPQIVGRKRRIIELTKFEILSI